MLDKREFLVLLVKTTFLHIMSDSSTNILFESRNIDKVSSQSNGNCNWNSSVVFTDATKLNINSFWQAIQLNVPIIMQGVSGSGKSFLIYEVGTRLGYSDRIYEINIDDQTDIKSLFGSYICSEVPGEFIWQSGIVTQSAMNGHWLVIKDIDKAPRDFIAALLPILERKKVPTPERGCGAEIDCHHEFRIIGTRSISNNNNNNSNNGLISGMIPSMKHFTFTWHLVNIKSLTCDEIKFIMLSRFSSLIPYVIERLMLTYSLLSGNNNSTNILLGQNHSDENSSELLITSSNESNENPINKLIINRIFTIKDLIKICKRIHINLAHHFNKHSNHLTNQQKVYCLQEVIDVYISSARDFRQFQLFTYEIGSIWEVYYADVDALILNAQPQLIRHPNSQDITIGRIHINPSLNYNVSTSTTAATSNTNNNTTNNKNQSNITYNINNNNQTFAYTRHDLKLLEKLACCVKMNESVLLVGETGCGKTTVIQELARLLNKKLIVQNLSLSTDTGDLLGGC